MGETWDRTGYSFASALAVQSIAGSLISPICSWIPSLGGYLSSWLLPVIRGNVVGSNVFFFVSQLQADEVFVWWGSGVKERL